MAAEQTSGLTTYEWAVLLQTFGIVTGKDRKSVV